MAVKNFLFSSTLKRLVGYTFFLASVFFVIFFLTFLFLLEPKKKHRLINFSNLDVLTALKWLEDRDLGVRVFRINDPEVRQYYVVSQRPEPGIEVKTGRKVILIVSDGANDIEMPTLVGMPFRVARKTLFSKFSGSNTVPEVLKVEEYSSNIPSGAVTRHLPKAKKKVNLSQEIVLYVSKGASKGNFKVQNYLLKNYSEVQAELVNNNLQVKVRYFPTEKEGDIGKIFSQSVAKDKILSPGDTIFFEVGIKKDAASQDFLEREVEILRVVSVLLPPAEDDASLLKVGGVVQDSRGEIVVPSVNYVGATSINFPYKTLGSGSIKIYVDGQLYKEDFF